MGIVAHVRDDKKEYVNEVQRLAPLGVRLEDFQKGGYLVHHNCELSLEVEIKSKKNLDTLSLDFKESILSKCNETFSQGGLST